jgi:hypothetical protein
MKKIILLGLFFIKPLFLASTSGFALCYSSKTNAEEIHQQSSKVAFQATGSLIIYFDDGSSSCGTATLIAPDALITAAHVLVSPGKQIKKISFQPQCSPSPISQDIIQQPKKRLDPSRLRTLRQNSKSRHSHRPTRSTLQPQPYPSSSTSNNSS